MLLGFLALFAFFDLIGELGDLGKGEYDLRQVFTFVAAQRAGARVRALPDRGADRHALRAVAARQQLRIHGDARLGAFAGTRRAILLKIGMAFVVLTFVLGEWVAPLSPRGGAAHQDPRALVDDRPGPAVGPLVQGRRLVHQRTRGAPGEHAAGGAHLRVRRKYRLRKITVRSAPNTASKGVWRLHHVACDALHARRATHRARRKEAEWHSAVSPDLLNALIVKPERMSAWALHKYTQHLGGNRQKTERYEIALWKKLFYPFATLVMMALALPFAYMQARAGMVGVKVFLGIMLGIFFHMLNSLFSHIGLLKNWPPLAAAAVPSAAFLASAMLMMWWVERR